MGNCNTNCILATPVFYGLPSLHCPPFRPPQERGANPPLLNNGTSCNTCYNPYSVARLLSGFFGYQIGGCRDFLGVIIRARRTIGKT